MKPDRQSLRLGFLAPGYPAGGEGDYRGIFVQQMVRALKARGHRVRVLTSRIRPGDPPYARIDEAEEVFRFGFWSEGKLLAEYQRIPLARMATYIASALASGYRTFHPFDCDLLHSHFLVPTGLIGALLAGALHRPHVLSVHGSDMRLATGKPLLRPPARWTLRHSQAITATATHQLEPLGRLGVAPERIIKMPMGINEAFLEPLLSDGPGEGSNGAARRVLSTRTLLETPYNVSQLIRAMQIVAAQDPTITCTVAGDGPDRPQLEALAAGLGLRDTVHFAGWADPARLARLLRDHALYVSASRADGASISLFEAMVSGAYPLLSDIPANREWVRPGDNGLLFPLDDPPALARAILHAVNTPDARQRGAQANRELALQTFTWPGIAQRLEVVYRSVQG